MSEQEIVIDRVAELENKISDMETANAQLSEMNTSLIEINKRLIDECIVDGGRIESLNEAPAQAQLEIAKHIEEVERRNKKIISYYYDCSNRFMKRENC